jgi:hypothetical protein
MPRLSERRSELPCVGQIDTDELEIPLNAYKAVRGFGLRRGFPFAEDGRTAYTTAEIRTSKNIRALKRWTRPHDSSIEEYAVCDGGLWRIDAVDTFTLLSKIETGGTASRAGTTVTIADAPNGTLIGVVRVGDRFWYTTSDSEAVGGTVTAVGATTLTLDAYTGSDVAGAYIIWRKLNDDDTWVVAAGDRLFIADGVGPIHEWGPNESGGSTYAFRQTGVPELSPEKAPKIALAAGGSLGAGEYQYFIAAGDNRGRIGNPVATRKFTASANNKATLSVMPAAVESPRAVDYYIYRSKVGSSAGFFHLTKNIIDRSTGVAGQVVTLATGGLTADAHIYRRLRFEATGNEYVITDNAAGTVTVTGSIAGEAVDDVVQIVGGYNIAAIQAAAATFVDFSSDDDLDTDNEAPTQNDAPPEALRCLVAFGGGGRIGGFTKHGMFYATGRSLAAPKQGLSDGATRGGGEYAYWTPEEFAFDVGREDGELVKGAFVLGNTLYAAKTDGVWRFQNVGDDTLTYVWVPHADGACLEGKTIAKLGDFMYWLGMDGGEIDVVRFNGEFVRGSLRKRLRQTLNGIKSISRATGMAYGGRYYLSYDSDGGGTNDRTLRFDNRRKQVDEQEWGCGVFMRPFISSASSVLRCGAPTAVGHIYTVEGSDLDLGSAVTRLLETGDIRPDEPEHEGQWAFLQIEVDVE